MLSPNAFALPELCLLRHYTSAHLMRDAVNNMGGKVQQAAAATEQQLRQQQDVYCYKRKNTAVFVRPKPEGRQD